MPRPRAGKTTLIRIQTKDRKGEICDPGKLDYALASRTNKVNNGAKLCSMNIPVGRGAGLNCGLTERKSDVSLNCTGLGDEEKEIKRRVTRALAANIRRKALRFISLSPPPIMARRYEDLGAERYNIRGCGKRYSNMLTRSKTETILAPTGRGIHRGNEHVGRPRRPVFAVATASHRNVLCRNEVEELIPERYLQLRNCCS